MTCARIVSLSLLILFAGITAELSVLAAPSGGGTCRIEVTTFRKSKKSSKRVFKIPADTAEDCRAAAKLHEENFNPKHISKVQVKSSFTSGKGGR